MEETKFRNIQKIIRQQAREFALITIAADVATEEGRERARIAQGFSNKHWEVVAENHGYTRDDFDYVEAANEAANEAFDESIRVEENG